MFFLSTKEIAEKWGIDVSLVLRFAREGRIDGAVRSGKQWLIPRDAPKPADGRKQSVRDNFRFPSFYEDESTYFPPLSEEEKQLRQGQLALHACRFEEAKELLFPLADYAQNRYVRIAALFHCCDLAVYDVDADEYERVLCAFNLELAQDFPHRREMLLLHYQMEANNGCYQSIWNDFRVTAQDAYHPSCYDVLANLSVISLVRGDFSLLSRIQFDTFELQCLQMERAGHFPEAQGLHFTLVELYRTQANLEMALSHMRRGFEIAIEHELYLRPAINTFYYPEAAIKALSDFPAAFAEKILSLGREIHEKYVKFSGLQQYASYLSILSDKDYMYISFAVQGYTNHSVAKKLKVSDQAVSKRYYAICEKLGVKNKQELVKMIKRTQTAGRDHGRE